VPGKGAFGAFCRDPLKTDDRSSFLVSIPFLPFLLFEKVMKSNIK